MIRAYRIGLLRATILAWAWLMFTGGLVAMAQAPATQPAARSAWRGPFFFIQMSDPQFGGYTANADFVKETELYEKAIAEVNRLKPAFVVITGDLINKPADPAQLAELKRISARLDKSIPLHLVPGNHDVENIPTPASLKFYRENVGKDYYSVDERGCHLIILNTTVLLRPDVPEEMAKQLEWLKQDAEATAARNPRPKYSMLFGHHPLFVTAAEEPDSGLAIPRVRRKTMLDMLVANRVMYMFAGHLHRNSAGKYGEFEMTSTSSVGKPSRQDPNGFRIVKVLEDRIEHEFVALDKMPQMVVVP